MGHRENQTGISRRCRQAYQARSDDASESVRNKIEGDLSLDPEERELALDALAKLLTKRVVERYRERVRRRARGR